LQYIDRLGDIYKLIKAQQENHLILQSLNSSIITIKDSSIKYFNTAGKYTLEQSINKLDNDDDKEDCNNELVELTNDIKNLKPTKES
jgi:nitrogen-specific signal transduction histidine kinase